MANCISGLPQIHNNDSNPNVNSIGNRSNQNSNLFNKNMPDDMTINILTYLREDLRKMDSMSKYFRPLIEEACKRECRYKILPPGILPKQWIFKFPKAMGIDCIQESIGQVKESDKNIPIPKNFIDHPRRGCNLGFLPNPLIVEVNENSPLELDETTAAGNNRARLVENQGKMDLPQTDKTKILIIPTTLRNTILIFQKCLKENFSFKFEGLHEWTWQNILDQHGDADVGPSHWTYEQEGVFEPGTSYNRQDELARKEGLEIAPLADAIFFELLTHINTGKIPQRNYTKRTSTLTLDNNGHLWPSTIWWRASGPLFRLGLGDGYDGDGSVGAAVRVPLGSS